MQTLLPLNLEQQQIVEQHTEEYITKGSDLFGQKFSMLPVLFDLTGRMAGMYRVKHGARVIRYNSYLFAKYFQENLSDTVPHEVAHYLTDAIYGYHRVKPHGREWKKIMLAFGLQPTVRCDFDMQGIPSRRMNYFSYHCSCRTHQLSSIRHNKIHQGRAEYYCRHCKQQLKQTHCE